MQMLVGGNYALTKTLSFDFGVIGGRFAVSPRFGVQVGFSADWWWHDFSSPQPSEEGIFDLAVSVFYYPSTEHHRFFIEGGPALSEAYATVTDSLALQRHGWGFTTGIGYDLAPRWVVSLTPRLAYSYAWVGDIYYPLGSNVPFANRPAPMTPMRKAPATA